MLDIFSYTSYRQFLKDFYEEKKRENKNFSYRFIAQKVGFKSAGHFTQIVKGQANISAHLVMNFCKFIKLKKREIEYFELLVNFNQAKTQDEQRLYFERIVSFKEVSAKIVSPEQYEFYQKWYYAVVRDLLSIYEFRSDYRELANIVQPSISTAEAEKAIKLLLALNLIRRNEKGVYEVTDSIISCDEHQHSIVLSGYASQMIDRAKDAANILPKEERIISWAGFSVSDETYSLIREELRTTRKKIMSLVKSDTKPVRVYHLNMHCFPVTKKIVNNKKISIRGLA